MGCFLETALKALLKGSLDALWEGLLWAMGEGAGAKGYSGLLWIILRTNLVDVLCYLEHFGGCAVEGLLWATLGPLW